MSAERVYFHVDLDAFFAAVEELDHPEFRGRPVIVGADPTTRGVVSTCNYAARAFGVRSAMPISQAARLCPQAVFVRPRLERYVQVSQQVLTILADFTPDVTALSIDEARLDMSGTRLLFGPPLEAAARLKERIRQEIGLTASVGIAPLPYLAKMASEEHKPDGVFEVRPEEVLAWLARLPPSRLPGVGQRTRQRLAELGIETVGQLQGLDPASLEPYLGRAQAEQLCLLAQGVQPTSWEEPPRSRSLGAEHTFEEDIAAFSILENALLDLAHQVFFRALDEGLSSRTFQLKIRYEDFSLHTYRRTLGGLLESGEHLAREARRLLKERWQGQPVRLLGLSLLDVRGRTQETPELFEDQRRQHRVEKAVLQIKARYRGVVIDKASLLKSPLSKGHS